MLLTLKIIIIADNIFLPILFLYYEQYILPTIPGANLFLDIVTR